LQALADACKNQIRFVADRLMAMVRGTTVHGQRDIA
jgi:hypothetical protein